MVKRFLIFSILALIVFVVQVSAQQSKHEKLVGLIEGVKAEVAKLSCENSGDECKSQALVTVFQRTENMALKRKSEEYGFDFEDDTRKLFKSLVMLLTYRGSIEVDVRSRAWIMTDVEARTKIVLPFLESLSNPEFTLGDVLNAFEDVEKRQRSKEKLN